MPTRIATLSLMFVLAAGTTASAQQQSLFGGGPTAGGGATAGAAGSAAAGGPAAAGAAFEAGGPQITTELGGLSQNAGQQGFLGRGVQGAVIGAGSPNTTGQAGAANTPNFRPGGGGGGGANNGGQQTGTRTISRPVIRIGFAFPTPPPPALGAIVRTRFVSIADRKPEFRSVQVDVDPAGVAIVAGTVPDESAAKLALALVRLEPGIRRVESDLVVVGR